MNTKPELSKIRELPLIDLKTVIGGIFCPKCPKPAVGGGPVVQGSDAFKRVTDE